MGLIIKTISKVVLNHNEVNTVVVTYVADYDQNDEDFITKINNPTVYVDRIFV